MDILLNTLTDALVWILLVLSIMAVLIGLWLLLGPESLSRFSASANRWVSTRAAGRPLEIPRYIERFFYRHHRIFGVLLMAGAAFSFYHLAFQYSQARALATLAIPQEGIVAEVMASSLITFLLLGNFIVFFVGATVLGRPSLLKAIEATSNRWISTRKAFKSIESRLDTPDRLALSHPRLLGSIIILGGLYAAVQLGIAAV